MRNNLLRGFLSIFSARVGYVILGIFITPVLVRLLSTSGYGEYAFIMSVLSVVMIFVNAGVFDGTRKFISEKRDMEKWTEYVFSFYFKIAILFAGVGAGIFAILSLSNIGNQLLGQGYDEYFYLLGLIIIGRQLFSVVRSSLMGLSMEHVSEPLDVTKQVLFAISGLSLVYVGYGVAGALIGHIVGSVISTTIALWYLRKKINIYSIFSDIPSEFPKRELFTFNINSIVLIFLINSLYNTDIILLRAIVGSQQTGYYKAALVIAEFLWFSQIALQTVLLHSSSELWSSGQKEKITEIASEVTRYNIIFTLLLLIGLAVLSNEFVPLYFGEDFREAVLPLLLLLPGTLGFALARPILAIGQGKGDLRALILATAIAALSNLVLNLVLIPRYGMIGASIATSVSYGSMFLLHTVVAWRLGFNPVSNVPIVRVVIASCITGSVIFTTDIFINSTIVSLVIIPPLGFILYTFIIFKTRAVQPSEIYQYSDRLSDPYDMYVRRIIKRIS